ncbi:hypothetical protein GGI21_005287, partial [Coemansia aciculifera]
MALAEANVAKANQSANKRRKKKTRKEKQDEDEERSRRLAHLYADKPEQIAPADVTIEYVEQQPSVEDTEFADYSTVFTQFANNAVRSFGAKEDEEGQDEGDSHGAAVGGKPHAATSAVESRPGDDHSSDDESDSGKGGDSAQQQQLSLKRQKKRNRMTVAQLKQIAPRPEVVEWTD